MGTNEVSFYAKVIYIITISTITTTVLNSIILNNNTLLLSGQQRLVADYFYFFLVKFLPLIRVKYSAHVQPVPDSTIATAVDIRREHGECLCFRLVLELFAVFELLFE